MTWQEYFNPDNKKSTTECPSKVGSDFMLAESNGCTVGEFLKQFEFASKDELQQAIRDLCYCIAGDKFIIWFKEIVKMQTSAVLHEYHL